MTIDFREFDQREHAPTQPDPIQPPDDDLQDRIRAALTLQRYMRDVKEREAAK